MLIHDQEEPYNDTLDAPKILRQSLTYQNSTINTVAPSGLASRSSIGLLKHPSFQMDSYDSRSDSQKGPKNANADLHLSEKKIEKKVEKISKKR